MSLPARGARIEIFIALSTALKVLKSLPARGARIEIAAADVCQNLIGGRSPPGERGLKWLDGFSAADADGGRSPQGERGLK